MRFSQDFIEKVRDANNLVEIISQHTELKRTGDRLMGRCPFPDHSEKTGSFSVTESKQLYHCFGCKKSGNIFTFLENFNGMSFPEAVEYLAKRASIELPPNEFNKNRNRDGREILVSINKAAGEYFHKQLLSLSAGHPAVEYVKARGLSQEIVDKFKLGVSLDAWEGLVTFLQQKKIALPMAESLGLLKRKKQGSGYFDLFRERLIFPILSPTDELLGFGGRTYSGATPKYLNSPETALFSKGRVLYGLHETGRYIRSEDHAIVVEGYMDAIALYAVGIKNVVAILGTAFTADHAKLLKRYTPNVTMLLDGDEAGQKAAERSLPILLAGGLLVKGCFLPGGLDPDDFIKQQGVDALKAEITRAPELFNLVLSRWLKDYRGSASEKVKLVDELYPVLKVMENKQLRELYVNEVAQRIDVDQSWLNRAFSAAAQKERSATVRVEGSLHAKGGGLPPAGASVRPGLSRVGALSSTDTATLVPIDPSLNPIDALMAEGSQAVLEEPMHPKVSVKGAPRDEAFVLSLILHNESLFQEARDTELLSVLSHSGIREAFAQALEKYRQSPDRFDRLAASLMSQIDQPSVVTCALDLNLRASAKKAEMRADTKSDSVETESASDDAEERRLMTGYVNAIRKRYYDQKLKALASQMRNQVSGPGHQEIMEQFMNMQKARHALDKE